MRQFLCARCCATRSSIGAQHGDWWGWFDTEAVKEYPWEEQESKRWQEMDARGRARWFTTQLWNCGDIVPHNYLGMINQAPGLTYAQVVSRLRQDVMEPSRQIATGERRQVRSMMIDGTTTMMEPRTVNGRELCRSASSRAARFTGLPRTGRHIV